MKIKKRIEIGDIFEATIDSNLKRYFQLVAVDRMYLGSDVIRVFKESYDMDYQPILEEIIENSVDFYVHCLVKAGIKLNMWKKIGYTEEIGDLNILFRDTMDYGIRPGQKPIEISTNWRVWKLGDFDFTEVGALTGEHTKAFIGIVISPLGVVELLKGRKYPPFYPSY